jgi:hypothetical protein
VITMPNARHQVAPALALIGGLVQAYVALSLLFVPVFATCMQTDTGLHCQRQSYVQLGGNWLGYIFLTLLIVVGAAAVAGNRDSNRQRVFFGRWLLTLISATVVVVAGWGFGITFLPGTLLLLLSAIFTRPWWSPSQRG